MTKSSKTHLTVANHGDTILQTVGGLALAAFAAPTVAAGATFAGIVIGGGALVTAHREHCMRLNAKKKSN